MVIEAHRFCQGREMVNMEKFLLRRNTFAMFVRLKISEDRFIRPTPQGDGK